MKLTKAQKLKVVLLAYEYFKEDVENCTLVDYPLWGMCSLLVRAYRKHEFDIIDYKNITELFPEMLNLKPEDVDVNFYWWPTTINEGVKPREKAFQTLIKLYSPKTKSK